MRKTDRQEDPALNLDDDDSIEIVEVWGMDEDSPGASVVPDDDPDELILTLDDPDPPGDPYLSDGAMASAVRTPAMSPSALRDVSDQERLLRVQADFENLKKRVEREAEETRRQAAAALIGRILPVLDNFERALSAEAGAETNADALRRGVALIFRQMLDELRKEGLEAIESVGQTFDPEVHEAVETGSVPEFPNDVVIEELQRGYRLRGRVLRPALVRVNVNLTAGDSGA